MPENVSPLRDHGDEPIARDSRRPALDGPAWSILAVYDTRDAAVLTCSAVERMVFAGRPVRLRQAGSPDEALEVLKGEPDAALVLIHTAVSHPEGWVGLARMIRESLGNTDIRIVLMTDPGSSAPDQDLILRYEVTDVHVTGQHPAEHLVTVIATSLRTFDRLRIIATQREELQRLKHSVEQHIEERAAPPLNTEQRLRAILDASVLPIFITAWADGTVLYANESARRQLGLVETLPDAAIWCAGEDRNDLMRRVQADGVVNAYEAQVQGLGGRRFWSLIAAIRITIDETQGVLLTFNDISSRKAMEEELKRLATTDALTGIANRRFLMDHGEREMRRARRYGSDLSVLIIDVDHFKDVNDRWGHTVGDAALKALVDCCLGELREIDILCRLGGEEFVALMPETPPDAALTAAERVRSAVAGMTVSAEGGVSFSMTVSIGLTAPRPGDAALTDILTRADEALYEAKNTGRNRIVVRV
ncbi:GGDEF domain-containing protein [Roseospira navarrensis]|uniref:diguanylate cyclase n=1 Tax=Roseospira navarrensis TaxID=140058 RepID=A0A7X1ZFX8_9PROT|nr:sensor domain-containing diguanylate cyclase [Roseospira navarrensis]MQX37858.1 diguanylate cyclase [Roseospira navarrensis]